MRKVVLTKLSNKHWIETHCPSFIDTLHDLSMLDQKCYSEIEDLSLNNYIFKTLPRKIFKLTNLEQFSLHSSELRKLPKNIGNLAKLKKLILSRNELASLPSEIGKLPNLKILYLMDNPLEALPRDLCLKIRKNDVKVNIDFEPLCKDDEYILP